MLAQMRENVVAQMRANVVCYMSFNPDGFCSRYYMTSVFMAYILNLIGLFHIVKNITSKCILHPATVFYLKKIIINLEESQICAYNKAGD